MRNVNQNIKIFKKMLFNCVDYCTKHTQNVIKYNLWKDVHRSCTARILHSHSGKLYVATDCISGY